MINLLSKSLHYTNKVFTGYGIFQSICTNKELVKKLIMFIKRKLSKDNRFGVVESILSFAVGAALTEVEYLVTIKLLNKVLAIIDK